MARQHKQPNAPKIVEVERTKLEEIIRHVEQSLGKEEADTIRAVLESYECLIELLEDKNISIERLRKLLFGSSSEKTDAVIGDPPVEEEASETDTGEPTSEDELSNESDTEVSEPELPAELLDDGTPPAPGHGRNGADAYQGAKQVEVPHDVHAPGDPCPECDGGKLYDKTPGVLIRIVGQAPLQATIYHLQKLRCHLCGKIFTASAPEEAGDAKYDATAASMIGLLKYGSGLPFNRLDRLQGTCQIPLPASTGWDVLAAVVPSLFPAYQELIRQAACGDVLYNDDTPVKILAWMGKRKEERTTDLDDDSLSPERTGLFTTGVVSTCAGRRIALFFSGRQHAGENLSDVLQHRDQELNASIQMCDRVHVKALVVVDVVPSRSGCTVGQQHLRASFEEGDSSPQELLVLQDGTWCGRGRPVHEFDLHLRVVRRERVGLSNPVTRERGPSRS